MGLKAGWKLFFLIIIYIIYYVYTHIHDIMLQQVQQIVPNRSKNRSSSSKI